MTFTLIRGRLHWLVRRRLSLAATRSDFNPQQHPSTRENHHPTSPRQPTL